MWWYNKVTQTANKCGCKSCRFLSYQCHLEGSGPSNVLTGNGGLEFGSGEGAWEMATTSTEGSRRENYPISRRWGSDQMYLYRHNRVY